jgi:Peptidase S24-like
VGTETPEVTARLLRGRLGDDGLWLPVGGGSMLPTIEPSAQVLITRERRPRRGEIWAFVGPDGSIVVHRYERRTGTRFVFHGDALTPTDPPVGGDVLIGRARAVRDERGGRRLGAADRARGVGGQVARRTRQGARWAVLLISRGKRSG